MALNLSVPQPRLLVRMVETPRGIKPMLADAEGNLLPMQIASSIEASADELTTVTVTFAVDEDRVRMVPDRMSETG
ncbi:MAG TPA: hypothetical protein VK973_04430 [Arenicellales bacterium]|nr:hypothetical protein [Arenicellales bacterium]